MIGNGPSAWWLDRESIRRLREAVPDLVLVGCNLAAAELGTDVGVAIDAGMFDRLVAHPDRPPLVATWRRDAAVEGPAGWVSMTPVEAGYSSGVGAVDLTRRWRPTQLVLLGFDGTADPRTRHQGTPGYRSRPTAASAYRRWEHRLLELAMDSPGTTWFRGWSEGASRLDELVLGRVDVAGIVAGRATWPRAPLAVGS